MLIRIADGHSGKGVDVVIIVYRLSGLGAADTGWIIDGGYDDGSGVIRNRVGNAVLRDGVSVTQDTRPSDVLLRVLPRGAVPG